jgi:cytoskeleton protein RodZ
LNRSTGAPPVVAARFKQRKFVSPGPWLAAIVVIVIAATAYWWFTARETPVARPVTGEVAPLPQDNASTTTEQELVEETDEAIVDELPVEPEPAPPPIATTESADLRLSVTFLGDCWTEITDANGRRLFFALGESGRTVNLSGEAPFNVLFGDAANVSLEVNGAGYTIPAADRRGRTARLTITGS